MYIYVRVYVYACVIVSVLSQYIMSCRSSRQLNCANCARAQITLDRQRNIYRNISKYKIKK